MTVSDAGPDPTEGTGLLADDTAAILHVGSARGGGGSGGAWFTAVMETMLKEGTRRLGFVFMAVGLGVSIIQGGLLLYLIRYLCTVLLEANRAQGFGG